jgi:hypothetical protein
MDNDAVRQAALPVLVQKHKRFLCYFQVRHVDFQPHVRGVAGHPSHGSGQSSPLRRAKLGVAMQIFMRLFLAWFIDSASVFGLVLLTSCIL